MKICFVSAHSFANPGGVRTHILNLSKRFEEKGHETAIIAPKSGNNRTPFNSDIPNLFEVGMAIAFPMNGATGDISLFTNREVYQFLEEKDFDILHFHNFLPFISSDALLLATDTPKVLTIHTLPSGFNEKIVTGKNLSKLVNFYDHTIFVSPSQHGMFSELESSYSLIPNGINIEEGVLPRTLKDGKTKKLLYVGRIEQRKGLDFLIEAFRQVLEKDSNVELHIVGKGNFDFLTKAYSSFLSLNDKVIFHGAVSDEELKKIRSEADIYISPAIKGESFGIVLLEAMAVGLPVIAFDNEGYRHVLTNELSGGLVERLNVKELANKILEFTSEPDLYEKMSSLGIEESKKYDWTKIADQIEDIYKKLV